MSPSQHVTLDELMHQLHQLLPECELGVDGPCLEPSRRGGRGIVLYPEGGRICTSTILLPGFNMLPDWLLGSE